MQIQLVKQVRDHAPFRESFIDLAIRTFDLSFADWYQNGYWTDRYLPYVLTEGERVVANASVNRMDTVWQGVPKCYIQIGTVMTDPAYRNRGLSKRLIEEILADWKDRCDGIYLYANDTVLDFYPKFGFERGWEYQYSLPVIPAAGDFVRLNMKSESDRALFRECYQKSNPFSELPMLDNWGLLMFYCSDLMKNNVYYSKKHHAAAVAKQAGKVLFCYDLFGEADKSLSTLLNELSDTRTEQAVLGFMPKDTQNCICDRIESDDYLFVFSEKENIFREHKVRFPYLSHA